MKPKYLIIDGQFRIYKSDILSGYVRSQARKGRLSVVELAGMRGMNCLKSYSEGGLQGDFGENEYSKIQDLPANFKVE